MAEAIAPKWIVLPVLSDTEHAAAILTAKNLLWVRLSDHKLYRSDAQLAMVNEIELVGL